MPRMDGYTAMREIRNRPGGAACHHRADRQAMKDDQEKCPRSRRDNDYIAKPLDVEKLLSLIAGVDAPVEPAMPHHKARTTRHRAAPQQSMRSRYHYDFRRATRGHRSSGGWRRRWCG